LARIQAAIAVVEPQGWAIEDLAQSYSCGVTFEQFDSRRNTGARFQPKHRDIILGRTDSGAVERRFGVGDCAVANRRVDELDFLQHKKRSDRGRSPRGAAVQLGFVQVDALIVVGRLVSHR
jgi:hypothetical protein